MGVFIWDAVHSPSVERQGCNGVGTRGNCVPTHFALDCIKTWLRSHRCASDTQFRTASQKPTNKQDDPMWKCLYVNAHFIRTI